MQKVLLHWSLSNTGVKKNLEDVSDLCNGFPACHFDTVSYSCVTVGRQNEHGSFLAAVYAVMAIVFLKEAAKLVGIMYIVCCRRKSARTLPRSLSYFVHCSPFTPLLLFLGYDTFKSVLVLADASYSDLLWELFYEGVLEDFPQFILAIVYYTGVVQTGLPAIGLISIPITTFNAAFHFLRAVYVYKHRWDHARLSLGNAHLLSVGQSKNEDEDTIQELDMLNSLNDPTAQGGLRVAEQTESLEPLKQTLLRQNSQ